eukprot:CAMPEP_0113495032 /NCGR_PEP_ID=MMETSP0014_2-20120614/29405_1 /TAXON_ID=2857 /ORGANISM="Nitzschia sp." /LENGTH=353 /DNA_ID=CAMNT_0000388927 /DNA_START=170 /DNA_END=1231 /DNA_ORIENTATION=+ /assembly_acc=CAM_ASM_000159
MKFTLALSALLAAASTTTTSAQNIVEVAQSDEAFSTLVDLVVQADLVETLSTGDPLTVFAPVNDAFDALPADVVANLLTDEWKLHLQDVLGYHVLPADVPASAIIDAGSVDATTLNGEDITAALVGESVVINEVSTVVTPDVPADNGLIHVVDTVLLPSWLSNSIVDRAVATPDLSTLVSLVTSAGLADTLSTGGPFTVFAPTNDAFTAVIAAATEALGTTDLPADLISTLLTYHVVEGIAPASAITEGLELETLQGEVITFSLEGGAPTVNGAGIIATDVLANNGIVHVIDAVLVPDGALDGTTMEPMPTEAPVEAPSMAPDTMMPSASSSRSMVAAGAVAFAAAAAAAMAF